MSLYEEILNHLPQDESGATEAAELFKVCKGADTPSDVSVALSQLFKQGKISRKASLNHSGRFSYWNPYKNDTASDADASSTSKEPIKPAANQAPAIGSLVDSLIKVIDHKKTNGESAPEINTEQAAADSQEIENDHTANADKPINALQIQEGGSHYKDMKIQPVEFIMANNIGFIEGNVIKYVTRWKKKNGVQDLKKARHFLDILIEQQK